MICNKETKKSLEKISGFICQGEKYRKINVIGKTVVKAEIITEDNKKGAFVRWEKGKGWRESGTGLGGNMKKRYYPIIGSCK